MAQYTNEKGYSALIVPDERITPANWDSDPVDMSEAGPRPGLAIPTAGTPSTVVRSHGQQGDTTYGVQISRGGYGYDAGYTWDQTTQGVTTATRGWNSPNFAQDIIYVGGGITSDETAGDPAVVTMGSGRMVWIYCIENVDHSPTTYAVAATHTDLLSMTDLVGGSGGIILAHNDTTDGPYAVATYYGASPDGLNCVCARWDDDRSVIQCWIRMVGTVSGERQFYLFESADGDTWTLVQKNCLASTITAVSAFQTPSVAKVQGCTTIVQPDNSGGVTMRLHQFVSYDGGQNFSKPYGTTTVDYHEYALAEFNDRVVVAARNGISDAIHTGLMGAPYEDLSTTVLTDIEAPPDGLHVSLAVMYGRVWLAVADTDGLQPKILTSTTGESDSWLTLGYDPLTFESVASGVSTTVVKIQPGLGGLILTLSPTGASVPTAQDGHLVALRLGGWASVCMPTVGDSNGDTARIAFGPVAGIGSSPYDGATYYPVCLPEDLDRGGSAIWHYSSSGTVTTAQVNTSYTTGIRLEAGLPGVTTGTHFWYSDFDGDIDTGLMVFFDGNVSAATDNDTVLAVYVFDGSAVIGCTLRFGPADNILFTDNGGTDSFSGDTVTVRYQYLIALRRAQPTDVFAVATLYRSTAISIADRYGWKQLGTVQCTPAAIGTPAGIRVQLFHEGDEAATLHVYGLHYRAYCGTYLIDDLASQPALGTYLAGAPLSSSPEELSGGFKLSFANGPARVGEAWTIPPKYDYAKEHVYPHLYPSPRVGWRSQEDNIEVIFSWQFNTDGAPEGFDTTSLALIMQDSNIREYSLVGVDISAVEQTIAEVSTSDDFASLEYRAGSTGPKSAPYIVPDTTSPAAVRYLHENELVGGWVIIDTGGGFVRSKIIRNTSGQWVSNSQAGKKPRIYLDPSTWSAATVPDSGTCDIVAPRSMVIRHGLGDTEYVALRLIIPAQYTPEGYYRIGQLLIGAAYVFGWQYSHGRILARTANTAVSTHIGGDRSAVVYGPTARSVQFGWFEGWNQEGLDTSGAVDYVTVSADTGSAHAVASRRDLATQLDGLYDRIDGDATLLGYAAHIPYSADPETPFITTRIDDFLVGRLDGGINRQTIRGIESVNESQTIESITIVEDV